MPVMLTKVVTDLEDLAVIHRSITVMEVKFSELVTRIGDAEKRIDYLESGLDWDKKSALAFFGPGGPPPPYNIYVYIYIYIYI